MIIKRKKHIVLLCVIALCLLAMVLLIVKSIPYNALTKNYSDNDSPQKIKITNDEYKAYEKYDIMISEDYLIDEQKGTKYSIIENFLKDQTVLSSQQLGNGVYYETYQYNNISELLPDFDSLIEIAFIQDRDFSRYCITYNTLNNEYVILEYYNNGFETKTILNKSTNELIILNNNNEKTLYENFK
ncbi:MAG: hypothetical protein GX386_09330 [Clostridiaceae bacterium]|nr:hypothetical protein [Clostridiaceae bacterium]